jgi:hypothetical protein
MGCGGRVFFRRHRRHVGEKHALEESIAQRSRRSQRGDGLWWQGVLWATPAASGRETRAGGKASHRGHEGHRGGMGCGGRVLWATPAASGRETRAGGKHRTKVTEVTKGGWAVGTRFSLRRHALRRPADPFLPGWAVAVATYASPYADTPYADPPTRFSRDGLWPSAHTLLPTPTRPTPTRRPVSPRPGLFGGHRGFRALRTATLVKRQPGQIEK